MINRAQSFAQIIFYIGLSCLFVHEMDAVAAQEWRLLPGLSKLNDPIGMQTFILLHIPLVIFILWISTHPNDKLRFRAQLIIDLALIVHGIVHFTMRAHDLYEFSPPVETITVYGGALIGAIHAMILGLNATKNKLG